MKDQEQMKNRILAILTSLPIIIGIIISIPLVISIAILTFFIPLSTYYLGLVLMARPKSKKEEEEREKITFTGY
jgi:uncharacterized membrane protein